MAVEGDAAGIGFVDLAREGGEGAELRRGEILRRHTVQADRHGARVVAACAAGMRSSARPASSVPSLRMK